MSGQKAMQPYEAAMYDFCDALDGIAKQKGSGPAWASQLASQAIASAAAFFPRTVERVLGDVEVATHKSTAARLPVKLKAAKSETHQLFEQLIAREGEAKVNGWLRQALGQPATGAVPGRGVATESDSLTTKAAAAPAFRKAGIADAIMETAAGGTGEPKPIVSQNKADDWMTGIGEGLARQQADEVRYEAWKRSNRDESAPPTLLK